MGRRSVIVIAGFGLFVGALYVPSCAPPVDAVAELAESSGVTLESRRVPTNGIELHVVAAGPADGAPVVLLHGFPEFWAAWREQVPRLARAGFRVLAPDQRGHNASEKPDGVEAYRMEMLEADIIGLLDEQGIERAHLAGHDLGAWVAWNLVIDHPDRFRSAVIFNSGHPQAERGGPEEDGKIGWHRTLAQIPYLPDLVARPANWWLVVSTLRRTARPETFPDSLLPAYRYAWHRDGAMDAMASWIRAGASYPRVLPDASVVRIPIRLVWGGQDAFIDTGSEEATLALCEEGEVVRIADAGHWLLHEEPELTSDLLIDFYRRVDRQDSVSGDAGGAAHRASDRLPTSPMR